MCGIFCVITEPSAEIQPDDQLKKILCNRGPNLNGSFFENGVYMHGFVLWQQGKIAAAQPCISSKSVLLLNGDVFSGLEGSRNASDTELLLSRIDECEDDIDLKELFRTIEGPYSVLIYNRERGDLYVARDSLGRNSLLVELEGKAIKFLSTSRNQPGSVATLELPPLGVYKLNVKEKCHKITLFPWTNLSEMQKDLLHQVEEFFSTSITLEHLINPHWLQFSKCTFGGFDLSHKTDCDDNGTNNKFAELLKIEMISETVKDLLHLIEKSVEDRIVNTPSMCSKCISQFGKITCKHCKVGILFSGGIDCTILAIMMDKFIPSDEPIDLLNVAFQKSNSITSSSSSSSSEVEWRVPDRVTAEETLIELKSLYPSRQWNLVTINVTREELESNLRDHIKHLIYPLKTILDESLGCSFWFAARGKGILDGVPYTSTCRVVIVGSGADELFGGYRRHRFAYVNCRGFQLEKYECLRKELDKDWERIPMRNLGRDDRVIADTGKTSRAPYIEENLAKFVNNLHPSQKCCFELPEGYGDKLILRLCGYKLGLRNVSKLKKRAIQFGSRIANKNQSAYNISEHLI